MIAPVLSVIVPAYNEQNRIQNCIAQLLDYLPRHVQSWEVIIVDDGSNDATWRILEQCKSVYHELNIIRNPHGGKGKAVRTGMLFATGEYRLMMDCDLSTPLSEIEHALEKIARADVVIGSRELDRKRVKATLKRRIMGRVFHSLVSGLVYDIRDTQCGFKIFRDYAAKHVFGLQKLDGWAFDVEILYLSQQLGYYVYEMPVEWHHTEGSKVQIVRSSLEMIRDVMSIPDLHRPRRALEIARARRNG